ncbi:acyltransferase family protein [Streptomyces sp. BI20]|uniref:acyltransferase family protein n=1 Tax=Streptomyces sp. BI20 TaxID=3403460 RepID=UPI003C766035
MHVLDGLRILAALAVVLYHYTAVVGAWSVNGRTKFPTLFPFAAYGWLGVQLFFLISGFVICMSCWGKPLQHFFVSRVVRLFPAYWFAVLATTAVVALIAGGKRPLQLTDVLVNLTMLQEPMGVRSVDGAYWTLFVELRFYVLFAVMAWWGLTYRRLVFFCWAWIVAGALFASAPEGGPLQMLVMPRYGWYFIAGIAFYLMHRFRPSLMLFGIVLVCFCGSLPTSRTTWRNTADYMGSHVPYWPVPLVVAACFGVMALVALGKFSWVNWRWLPFAGSLTYPLYLLHENIGHELFHLFEDRVPTHLLLGSVLAGMLIAAWLVHRWVERPVGRLLKRGLAGL